MGTMVVGTTVVEVVEVVVVLVDVVVVTIDVVGVVARPPEPPCPKKSMLATMKPAIANAASPRAALVFGETSSRKYELSLPANSKQRFLTNSKKPMIPAPARPSRARRPAPRPPEPDSTIVGSDPIRLPPYVSQVIKRSLSPSPQERYLSAAQMAAALDPNYVMESTVGFSGFGMPLSQVDSGLSDERTQVWVAAEAGSRMGSDPTIVESGSGLS